LQHLASHVSRHNDMAYDSVFAVVTIAIFALMMMALLPLLMQRHPWFCQAGIVAL
jgi:hypothetical protein